MHLATSGSNIISFLFSEIIQKLQNIIKKRRYVEIWSTFSGNFESYHNACNFGNEIMLKAKQK